jgi:hypothetical protein
LEARPPRPPAAAQPNDAARQFSDVPTRQAPAPREHFHRPVKRPFTAAERDRVTILFGGLTSKHEWLIKSAFQAAGYKVEVLPTPDVASFQLGKEYRNNGQCNPTYFTVGHLINYLQHLESRGRDEADADAPASRQW